MKKHLLVKTALSGLFATLCTVGIVSFPGCQKQDYDYSEKDDLDPALLNSPELEEYIIAGADFQQTLNIFKDEINKIIFVKLLRFIGRTIRFLFPKRTIRPVFSGNCNDCEVSGMIRFFRRNRFAVLL